MIWNENPWYHRDIEDTIRNLPFLSWSSLWFNTIIRLKLPLTEKIRKKKWKFEKLTMRSGEKYSGFVTHGQKTKIRSRSYLLNMKIVIPDVRVDSFFTGIPIILSSFSFWIIFDWFSAITRLWITAKKPSMLAMLNVKTCHVDTRINWCSWMCGFFPIM